MHLNQRERELRRVVSRIRARSGGKLLSSRSKIVDLPNDWFAREDETPDEVFYREPRLGVHIDDATIEAVRNYYAEALPPSGLILDLMSSWRSHLPSARQSRVVGLGMNEIELAENPELDRRVVHDLNANPKMELPDDSFDAAIVNVSVQYMTRPVAIFADVWRVVKSGCSFHVIFSDRIFPTKAVSIWLSLPSPAKRSDLIQSYFELGGNWDQIEFINRSPGGAFDPLYIVRAVAR